MGLETKLDAAANAAASVSFTNPRYLQWIAYSYDAAPTGGKLTVKQGATTIFELDVTAAGAKFLDFARNQLAMTASATVTVTLAAGGAGVTGKLNVMAG